MSSEQNTSETPMADAKLTPQGDENSVRDERLTLRWRTAAALWVRRSVAAAQVLGRLSLRVYRLLLYLWQRFNAIHWPKLPFTPLQWLALGFVFGGALFALLTPPFEIGDEFAHFARLQGRPAGEWGVVAYQPPLYYAVFGQLGRVSDESLRPYLQPNPYVRPFDLFGTANKNLFLRDNQGGLPVGLPVLALLRLANVALVALALWPIARIGALIAPQRPSVALLGAALLAFNPMMMALGASVNNFAAGLLALSWATYGLMRAVRQGWHWLNVSLTLMAVVLALNLHSAAWLSLPVIVLAGVWIAACDRAWLRYGVLLLSLVALIVLSLGGWMSDNLAQHGDPWGLGGLLATVGARSMPLDVVQLLENFGLFRAAYWGVFGADNVLASPLVYLVADLVTFLGLFGLIFTVAQLYAIRDFTHARRELIGLLPLLGLALLAMILYLVALATARHAPPQMVLLFMPAFGPLLAVGLVEVYWWGVFLFMPPDRSFVRAGDAVPHEALVPLVRGNWQVLALLALLTPITIIAPQYQPPAPLTDLPSSVTRVYARYGPIELLGYRAADRRYLPGERVPITLYWRAIEPTERDYMLSVGFVSPDGQEIGKLDSFPLGGRLRTSQWPPGAIYEDHLEVRLSLLAGGPYPLRLQVTWWDREAQARVPAQDERMRDLPAVLLDVGALAVPLAQNVDIGRAFADLASGNASRPPFGEGLRPNLYTFDRYTRLLRVEWQAIQPLLDDYTLFAHVVDQRGQVVAQDDVRPALPTRYWRISEPIMIDYDLQRRLPPGQYEVLLGVYRWPSLERLPLQGGFLSDLRLIEEATPMPEEAALPPTTYRLFGFTIDENGAFISSELDVLLPETTPESTAAPEK
ncbi:MAG: hypothetical protein NZ750_04155 [Anaerolineae bacterium]|nr:hypothetical protein [Anaerolineae bacterium]MDW8171514.1 hypothetical protein [Anaerolineae bacterium]